MSVVKKFKTDSAEFPIVDVSIGQFDGQFSVQVAASAPVRFRRSAVEGIGKTEADAIAKFKRQFQMQFGVQIVEAQTQINRAQKLVELCEAEKVITILYNREYDEYRAPGPKGTEAQAYYTNDEDDARSTLVAEWKRAGITVDPASIKIKKVDEWPKGMGN